MPSSDLEPKHEAKPEAKPSQDVLVADIDRTRQELAATIDAIADRLNPANAARRTVDQVRERIAGLDPVIVGGAVVAVAGTLLAWRLLRRRRR